MNQPSVSIIVPVYNVGPYVEDCIGSVMRQTYYGKMECIVVDDCGTDDSMAIVERLVAKYSGPITFKILHHTHNRGLSAARNTGMDAATGDYLFFLDSDDELTDDCIEKLTEPLDKEWYDVVVGNFDILVHNDELHYKAQKLLIPNNTLMYGGSILKCYKEKKMPITAWNKLYLTNFIRKSKYQFKEGIILEDVLWSFQIACSTNTMYCVNHTTYLYRRRIGSITNSDRNEFRAYSYLVRFIEMCEFVRNKGISFTQVYEILLVNHHCALKLYLNSQNEFVRTYKTMREYLHPSIIDIIIANKFYLKKYVRDIHYVLPKTIASYWHFYFYYHFRLFLLSLKNHH